MLLAIRVVDVGFLQSLNEVEVAQDSDAVTKKASQTMPERGRIFDRNGELLAISLPSYAAYARPDIIARFGTEEAVEKLATTLEGESIDSLHKKLNPARKFTYLKRDLSPAEMEATNALGIPGVEFERNMRRVYPHGALFSHLLGQTDIDGNGVSSVEKQYNGLLGKKGEDLTLSVDTRLQHILREELLSGMEEFKAIGGVGVIMDIHNGEVMALSSLPDFDANDINNASADARFNRAITGVYEMGSTFKTFTMAMALEHKTARLYDRYDTTKPIRVARYTIRDSHPEDHWLTVPEIFMHSSNIGTVRMIMEVGKERQQRFLKQLGLFDRVPLNLPETASPLVPHRWRDINMMTISYGHGISVTPMHVVQAIGSLLGDGKLLHPTLLKGQKQAEERPQIVSQETVQHLRKLMRLVVEHGTASKADAQGYRVGGKTGTAEKVKNGNYRDKDKLASFVGIFPTEAPRYVILAMLDEPRGNKSTYGYATGGWVAAPVVKRIVERMAPLYGIRPVIELPSPEDSPKKGAIHTISF